MNVSSEGGEKTFTFDLTMQESGNASVAMTGSFTGNLSALFE